MEQILNSERHFNPVVVSKRRPSKSYGCTKSLAELAGTSTPNKATQSTAPVRDEQLEETFPEAPVCAGTVRRLEELPAGPVLVDARPESNNGGFTNATSKEVPIASNPEQRRSKVNDIFADLVYGDRVNDSGLQQEALCKFHPVILFAARTTGYLRCLKNHRALCDGDWESTGNFCLAEQVLKFREVPLHEIDKLWEANRFSYVWKALCDDFKDEMRTIRRRPELFAGDTPENGSEIPDPSCQTEPEYSYSVGSKAGQLQQVAQALPRGQAAIAGLIAELMLNPEQFEKLTDLNSSDTAFKTAFVEYGAQRRGVGVQVARRDVKQFKDHVDLREYACVPEILRNSIPYSKGTFAFPKRIDDETL
jgi:hypothetical protein